MFKRLCKLVVLMTCIISVSSCGSSDSEDEPTSTNEVSSNPTVGTGGGTTEEILGGADDDDRLNATALFRSSECGSIALSPTVFSNDSSLPAVFNEGELVGGRIDPASATNTVHYWSINLSAGFYHVLLDTARVDGRDSNVGLQLRELDNEDSSRIIRGNEIDFRTRFYAFLEVENDRTLTLQINPNFSDEDYLLGIFPNGVNVPVPYFEDCPVVTPLSLGETVAVDLADGPVRAETDSWYSIDLDLGDYLLSSFAQRQDGVSSNVIYEFLAFEQFAQASRKTTVSRVNEIAASAEGSGGLSRSETGTVWFRLRNDNDALSLQFTLQDDS